MPPSKTHTLSPTVFNHVHCIRVFPAFQPKNESFFLESNSKVPPCPCCGGRLAYRDCRKRIMRRGGGQKDWVCVRRFRCQKCGSYHVELPDCLLPYKHYQTEVISGVLDETVTSDDLGYENYPSFMTMLRWLQWFRQNLENMKGYLRQVSRWIRGRSAPFALEQIRESVSNWLGTIMRIIYNSGGSLGTFRR